MEMSSETGADEVDVANAEIAELQQIVELMEQRKASFSLTGVGVSGSFDSGYMVSGIPIGGDIDSNSDMDGSSAGESE